MRIIVYMNVLVVSFSRGALWGSVSENLSSSTNPQIPHTHTHSNTHTFPMHTHSQHTHLSFKFVLSAFLPFLDSSHCFSCFQSILGSQKLARLTCVYKAGHVITTSWFRNKTMYLTGTVVGTATGPGLPYIRRLYDRIDSCINQDPL